LANLGGARLKSVGLTAFVLTTLLFNLLFTNFDEATFGGFEA
jgi:hypothetical protein